MRRIIFALFVVVVICMGSSAAADLEVLDRPMWIFPGQQFRLCLRQPEGSGELTCDYPDTVEMFDTWDQDDIQRYYFRSLKPGDATLQFSGEGGQMTMELEVIPWSDVYAPRQHKNIQLPRIWPLEEPDYQGLKTRRTLHSETDLQKLREGSVAGRAERWLQTPDEEIYNIIPGPSVPRTCLMVLGSQEGGGIGKGCPVCGTDIYEGRSGFYPWKFGDLDSDHAWKVQCPNCETWFPSNDWQNGDMHSGPFPDDGFGCEPVEPVTDENGRAWRFPFIAYYHQWQAYMKELTPGIVESAEAFVATGDKEYAHKCAIGLFRYAESIKKENYFLHMDNIKLIAKNKKARHEYFILSNHEAGIALVGTEVKSVRNSRISFLDSYARVDNDELLLIGMHISPYDQGNINNHDPIRTRKLLMHSREIERLRRDTEEKGLTLIPLSVYLKNGKVKIEIGVAKGKHLYDKRADKAKHDAKREMERARKKSYRI